MGIVSTSATLNQMHSKGKELVDALKKELEAQGHKASGRLYRSIRYKVEKRGKTISLKLFMAGYGWDVNNGQPPRDIPVSVIETWVRRKKIAVGKEIKKAAWAIKKTIAVEGTPTKGSFRFSSTGKRRGFVNIVLGRRRISIKKSFKQSFSVDMERTFRKLARDIDAKNPNLKRI